MEVECNEPCKYKKYYKKGKIQVYKTCIIQGKMKEETEPLETNKKEETFYDNNNYREYWKEYKEKNIDDMPGIPITSKEREIKLIEYMDKELSQKEEEEFYEKEEATYSVRMDTDIDYNNEMYYKKFYISKDIIVEKNEKGIFDSSGVYILPSELRQMGKEGLISVEENEKPIFKEYEDGTTIIHWTAPIADLYYDNENKPKRINEYTYNVMLKREFSFNPFTFYDSYIADNKFYNDGTVDKFLIKILLDKKDSNVLTDIIYTIQANQNKIIRANEQENFIVQGCAGSGKTMILLHRLSYLKFNNKLPDYDKIKIITPNILFSNFIKDLSKDLSIDEIKQITIEDYYKELNKLYNERYNKLEEIDDKFYIRHKDRYKRTFEIENEIHEFEVADDNTKSIYSQKMLDMIEKEYNNIIIKFEKELREKNIEIENQYSCNKIYFEQVIINITKKIKDLERRTNNIDKYSIDIKTKIKELENLLEKLKLIKQQIKTGKNIKNNDIEIKDDEFCINMKRKIRDLEKLINNLNHIKTQNYQIIEQIKVKCTKMENEKERKIKGKKIFFENARNTSIEKQYSAALKSEYEKIDNLKLRQTKIQEELGNKEKEKTELVKKLEDYKNTKQYYEILNLKDEDIKNIKISSYKILEMEELKTKEKDELIKKLIECQKDKDETKNKINEYIDIKTKILDNVYFTFDIYKNIITQIKEKFHLIIEKNKYSKMDLLTILYLNYLHIGEIINGDKLLCIDEAQDYNEIEFEIISTVNKNVVMNLYGDINQSIYKNGIYNWDNISSYLNSNVYELTENYRNTMEITDYCNKKFKYSILGMGLSIKPVEIIEEERVNEIINEKINQKKTIAIITKNEFCNKINNKLVSYCNIQDIKGIEYNTVIVNDKDMNKNEKYIAYTRALSELYILK